MTELATNPKESRGARKPDMSLIPATALEQLARVHMHGTEKYGAYSWRLTKIATRTYIAATMRHLLAYAEGKDLDPDSGMPHLAHAMASLAILIDAEECGMAVDNRVLRPDIADEEEHIEPRVTSTNVMVDYGNKKIAPEQDKYIAGFMPYVVTRDMDGTEKHTDLVVYLQQEELVESPEPGTFTEPYVHTDFDPDTGIAVGPWARQPGE